MKRRAVFLDRDGVINEEVEYLSSPDRLRLIPGAAQAIQLLNQMSIPTIVVTNQSGVARGYYPEAQVHVIHRALSDLLAADGAVVDRYYYCPHHPTEGTGAYRVECNCRKPKPGMLLQASEEFNLDLTGCYVVGDNALDIEAGQRVGAQSILVLTGYGEALWRSWSASFMPDHVASDLGDAVKWIVTSLQMDWITASAHRQAKKGDDAHD